jgi:hypothetical protein
VVSKLRLLRREVDPLLESLVRDHGMNGNGIIRPQAGYSIEVLPLPSSTMVALRETNDSLLESRPCCHRNLTLNFEGIEAKCGQARSTFPGRTMYLFCLAHSDSGTTLIANVTKYNAYSWLEN